MQQTIAAVFDDTVTARQAMDDLIDSGFSRDAIKLSGNGVASADTPPHDGEGFQDMFADLFGRDDARTQTYTTAVARGNCVLTLACEAADCGRATDILDRYRPLSVDEHPDQWQDAAWSGDARPGMTLVPPPSRLGETAASMGREDTAASVADTFTGSTDSGSRMGLDTGLLWQTSDFSEGYSTDMGTITEGQGLHMEEPPMTRLMWPRRPAPGARSVQPAPTDGAAADPAVPSATPAQRADDAYYRTHWRTHYGSDDADFAEFEPAYRYGALMSRDQQYQGRDWDDVEPELASRWSKHGGSTWERMRSAIRHGWQRITHHGPDHS